MNRTNRILPVYAGDVSGACSALFELDGMVVIHDPSGCNSTYNTHDETRWYDHDSLIFISALMERDAILGNDDKLVRDVVDAAHELHPRFIALCNSPIPFITGTDFAALCRIIERETGIPCLYVRTNGMHDYVVGAGNAFVALSERFVAPAARTSTRSLNILGVTPLDFCEDGAPAKLRAFACDAGFSVTSCWAMGSTLDELARSAEAHVNLVVSAAGLPLAHALHERFGTPFVVGTPVDGFQDALAKSLRTACDSGTCSYPCRDLRSASQDGTACIVGDPVVCGSRAVVLEHTNRAPLRVLCPTEAAPELLTPTDVRVDGEEEAEAALAQARHVWADCLYQPICPSNAELTAVPHFAFSGRNALTHMP